MEKQAEKNNVTEVEFEEIKGNLIEGLRTKIYSLQEDLFYKDIGTSEYNEAFNRFNIAYKELSILQSLTFKNYKVELMKMQYIKSNYGFFNELSESKINELLGILNEYQRSGFFKYSKTFKIPKNITVEKEEKEEDIPINSSKDISEIKNTISVLKDKKRNIDSIIRLLKKQKSTVITTEYILLSNACRESRVIENDILRSLEKSYPYTEHYIKRIIENKRKLNMLKDSPFKKKEFESTLDLVLRTQNEMLRNITSYICYKLDCIKDDNGEELKFNVDDVFVKYSMIEDAFITKKKNLEQLLNSLLGYYTDYTTFESRLISALNNIYSIKNRDDIDKISDLDRDKVNSIIATLNTYDKTSIILKRPDEDTKALRKANDD